MRWPERILSFGLLCLLASQPAAAVDVTDRLQIFGHLTQAYGESGKGSIQGATESGTTDLRKIALQFFWRISDKEAAVVQFSHERRGNDILFTEHEEVLVDWAFYENWLTPSTILRVGRLNVPLGIYNEVRDVGTVLPFFNLPLSFYAGVLNSAETVDGVSVEQKIAPRSKWNLETHFYYGGWDTAQQQIQPEAEFSLVNLEARAEDGLGVQLWLHTPADGLRVGAGALTWLLDGPLSRRGTKDRWQTHHVSLDASFERWMLRAERRWWRADVDFGAFINVPVALEGMARREGFYVQAGYWLIKDKLGLFGQYEETSLSDNIDLFPQLDNLHKARAVSLNYRFRPDLVLKVELHDADTRLPLGDPDTPDTVGADPVGVDWFLIAFSVDF